MSFRTTAWATAMAMGAMTASATADAQDQPRIVSTAGDDAPIQNGALSALGAIVGGLRIDASLNTLFDSNILRLGDGLTPAPGQDKADFRVTPAVSASYGTNIGRQQLFLGGTIGRDIYLRNSDRNRNHYGFNGGLNWRLGARCSGLLDANYSSRQQLFSEVSVNTPNVQQLFSYGGSASCQTGAGLGFGASARHSTTRNNSDARRPFDTNSTSVSPQITYGSPVLGQFSLSGAYNHVTYPNRDVIAGDGSIDSDGIDILSGRVGYQRGLGSRLSANIGLSYYTTKPQPRDILIPIAPGIGVPVSRDSRSNLGYDFGINYNSGNRLTASFTARKSAAASINVGAQSQVVQAFAGDIGYRLNRAISLNTGISHTQRDYRNSFTSIEEPQRRTQDKITRVFGGVSYAPGGRYSVSAEVAYQDRASKPEIYSYNSVSALLRLRVGFGGRG